MAVVTGVARVEQPDVLTRLNTEWHGKAMAVFAFIVVAHWLEHLAQAYQIWVLHRPRPKALGVLGMWKPWLVTSEWLHYGYAIVMLAFLLALLPGMTGRARTFWIIALAIQFWHHIEHGLLLYQAQAHHNLFSGAKPTSVLQAAFPMKRVEIHLIYNALVTIPMIVAAYYHFYPPRRERQQRRDASVSTLTCNCARAA